VGVNERNADLQRQIEEKLFPRFTNQHRVNFDSGYGWYPLLLDIDSRLSAIDPNYQIKQIKEKFGLLRYYCNLSPEFVTALQESGTPESLETLKSATRKFNTIVLEGQGRSADICEDCGVEDNLVYTGPEPPDRRLREMFEDPEAGTIPDDKRADYNRISDEEWDKYDDAIDAWMELRNVTTEANPGRIWERTLCKKCRAE